MRVCVCERESDAMSCLAWLSFFALVVTGESTNFGIWVIGFLIMVMEWSGNRTCEERTESLPLAIGTSF